MQMYEVTNGAVTLQSEIETDGVALFPEEGISEIFYLVPNVEKTIYQCYDAEGNLSYTIP